MNIDEFRKNIAKNRFHIFSELEVNLGSLIQQILINTCILLVCFERIRKNTED